MPVVDFFKEIPELGEAVKRENDSRDAAFLDVEADVCGVKLRQMNAEDLLILEGVGNAVVSGQIPGPEELVFFLWQVATPIEKTVDLKSFTIRVRALDYEKVVEGCAKYMAVTLQDSPGGSGSKRRPIASWVAHLIDRLASEYGWHEEYIMRLPLRRAFQYQNLIRWRKDPDFNGSNPSDRLIGDYVAKVGRNQNQRAN